MSVHEGCKIGKHACTAQVTGAHVGTAAGLAALFHMELALTAAILVDRSKADSYWLQGSKFDTFDGKTDKPLVLLRATRG